jgi:hypothetical protein
MKKTLVLICLLSFGLLSSALVAAPRDKCGCGAGGGVPRPTGNPPAKPQPAAVKPAPAQPTAAARPAAVARPGKTTTTTRAPRPNREQNVRPRPS